MQPSNLGHLSNHAVMTKVCGWTEEGDRLWKDPGGRLFVRDFQPLADAGDDFLVLQAVRKWIDLDDDRYNKFYRTLAEMLRSRDPYYRGTVNQFELYYMDQYQAGDFSRAAWVAIGGEL